MACALDLKGTAQECQALMPKIFQKSLWQEMAM
jgi:hypothetical protein